MNIEENEYIQSLEKRIEKLENLLEHMCIRQCKEISLSNCPIGDIELGDNCNINLQTCSVGTMIPDIDEAENRIEDLESRLDAVLTDLDEAECRLDGFETDSKE